MYRRHPEERKLADLDISQRPRNALFNHFGPEVTTRELYVFFETGESEKLLRIPSFGRKGLREVKDLLFSDDNPEEKGQLEGLPEILCSYLSNLHAVRKLALYELAECGILEGAVVEAVFKCPWLGYKEELRTFRLNRISFDVNGTVILHGFLKSSGKKGTFNGTIYEIGNPTRVKKIL